MPTLVGAGAVGLVLGARLARAGEDVRIVTRRPEVAARIEREGVRVEDPATGESWTARVRAVAGIAADNPGRCIALVTHLGVIRALLPGSEIDNADWRRLDGDQIPEPE